MKLNVSIGNNLSIRYFDGMLSLEVPDISVLTSLSEKEIITDIIRNDKIINTFGVSDRIINLIFDYVFNDLDLDVLKDELAKERLPLFSFIINVATGYKKKYMSLLDVSTIHIGCNIDNMKDILGIVHRLDKEVVIDAHTIAIKDFYDILSLIDRDCFDDKIRVYYLKENSSISISKLYDIACIINDVISDILKYNLSPLEKVMYVYDIVKYRIYKKDDCDFRNSKDLDKVIDGSYIACGGYTNLFNAILNSLGIGSLPLISHEVKHQRSITYIKDDKYGVDGIYVFDPTWDSRKKASDTSYIDNYNYFMLPLDKASYSAYDETSEIFDLGVSKIYSIIRDKNNIDAGVALVQKLNNIFIFAGNYYFTDNDYYHKEEFTNNYREVLKKYRVKDLDIDSFVRLLYCTRKVQYYSGLTDRFDLQDIREAVYQRFFRIKKMEIKRGKASSEEKFIKCLLYDSLVNDSLMDNSLLKDSEREVLNTKLLKKLRMIRDGKRSY